MEGLSIRAEKVNYGHQIGVAMIHRHGDGRMSVAGPLTMVEHQDGTWIQDTIVLEPPAAQQLMDDLWRAGVRSTEGQGSTGQLGAIKEHLSDMRKLVEKFAGAALNPCPMGSKRNRNDLFAGDHIEMVGGEYVHVRSGTKLCLVEGGA